MPRNISHTVTKEEEGRTILSLLRGVLGFSASQVRRMKESGGILLENTSAYTNQRVREGQVLLCRMEEDHSSQNILPVPGPLCIRYEDNDLLVLDKPAGVPVHPSQGHFTDSLANFLAYEMEENRGIPFVFRGINRLDRNTSGLLTVAKHPHAQHLLSRQLHTGEFHREYQALVCGAVRPAEGTVDAPILDIPGVLRRVISPEGAPAVTHYETLEEGGPYALLRLWLETGRTHQIRLHMAHIGHPLAGDFLYGTQLPSPCSSHALHSSCIRLRQPITGETIQVESPLPPFFSQLLQKAK